MNCACSARETKGKHNHVISPRRDAMSLFGRISKMSAPWSAALFIAISSISLREDVVGRLRPNMW